MGTPRARSAAVAVLAAVLAVLVWWFATPDGEQSAPTQADASSASDPAAADSGDAADPHSGLPWIAVSELPEQAQDVLERIDRGGPFRYDKDGSFFGNFERILPDERRGYYREYTVDTPGLSHRGPRRIVTGSAGEYYWTQDHYESFERIDR